MKYSTVIVAACIGGASLATAVQSDSNPHPYLDTPRIQEPSLLSNTKQRVGNNENQFEKTTVEAKGRQGLAQSQNGGNLVQDVDTWDKAQPPTVGEPVALPRLDSVSRRLRKVKGPQRLPKHNQEETAPVRLHKEKSSMTLDTQRTTDGTTLAETSSQTNTGDTLPHSLAPLPSANELNVEARSLDIENLNARAIEDVESLLGRNFFDDVKENYRVRKAKYYEKKAAQETALAGIQTPSRSGGGEVQDSVESLPGEGTAHGYGDAELRTRDFIQSLNAAADTVFRKKPSASTQVVVNNSIDSPSDKIEARGYDDAKLEARDNIFEQIGRGVGAIVDTFKGKTPASSGSVSSIPTADSSFGTETSTEESSSEELAARGYDVADLKARNIFSNGLEKIFSSEKSAGSDHQSMVTTSGHPSMDAYSYVNESTPMVQRDFAEREYLKSRDIQKDHHESHDLSEMDLLERSIRKELAARGYDDGDLETRNLFLSGLRRIISSKKSTSSGHSSMDTYTHDDGNTTVVQRDFVDGEYLDSRDLDARDFEEELHARDFEIDELD